MYTFSVSLKYSRDGQKWLGKTVTIKAEPALPHLQLLFLFYLCNPYSIELHHSIYHNTQFF